MVQIIPKQQSISGRIGKGFGQGLAEQIPKEIDRYRLSSGLKKLGENQNLDPFQAFAELSAIPGITPQMIDSGSRLLAQRSRGNAFKNGMTEDGRPINPFKQNTKRNESESNEENLKPSITTRTPIEATLNPYIPKSFQEIQNRAGQLLEENPAAYNYDPQVALESARQEDAQNQSINAALQGQRTNEQNVQNNVVSELQNQRSALGAQLPDNIYSDIEDKAINAVKSKKDGGEGLTEQQAKKKYGNELDKISRQYKAIESVGDYSVLTRTPSGNKQTLRSIRKDFKDRNDLENLADSYIAKNGLSPSKAYYLAYPVSENKELNNALAKLPKIEKVNFKSGFPVPTPDIDKKTLELSKKLSSLLGKESSPLSVAEELRSRNYDPNIWMEYLDKNREKLDLTERQVRELNKPRDFTNSLNDLWMFLFSGLDKLVEQE